MEHPCHRCRANVEDGVAFCPHCGAPQIRVSPAVAPVLSPDTLGEVQPPPVGLAHVSLGAIDWSQGIRASALAGLVLASAIFFVSWIAAIIGLILHLGQAAIGLLVLLASWCCMILAGALAVRFYRRRRPEAAISPGMGARLGVVSGMVGFSSYGVLQSLRLALFHGGGEVREAMQKAIEQSAARSPDPAAQDMARNLLSPVGLAAIFTVVVVIILLIFLVLSSLGGAIGASIWGNKHSS